LKQKEEEGNTLVIRPAEKLKIGHVSHSRKKMWETYNIGRKAAEDRLEEIISFISA
jgi:predicted patatin/cPLA2 family phospholipase